MQLVTYIILIDSSSKFHSMYKYWPSNKDINIITIIIIIDTLALLLISLPLKYYQINIHTHNSGADKKARSQVSE